MHPLNRRSVGALLLGGLFVLPGCGGDDSSRGPVASTRSTASTTGRSCPDVPVPGHEAVDVRVTGPTCAVATGVARDAGGRGRAAYRSSGFSCTPTDAPAGDTDYTCRRNDSRITFRYGAA